MGSIAIVCALSLPLLLLAADHGSMELLFAGCALTGAIAATLARDFVVRAGFGSAAQLVALTGFALLTPIWARFWILDLSAARFRIALAIVPAVTTAVVLASHAFGRPIPVTFAIVMGLAVL